MREHTRKPLTEVVRMTFSGPAATKQIAVETMRKLGFEAEQQVHNRQTEDSISWRESVCFEDMPFPGSYLAGFRHREGMTQMELAKHSGIPRRHISEMENGKRPIGKANARKIAEVLNIDPRLLLSV